MFNVQTFVKFTNLILHEGLFTADQNLKGTTSKYTRQNPNGGRSGYECPEERDYYPYWHPTDWIDEAVLVKRQESCAYYEAESFNNKLKGMAQTNDMSQLARFNKDHATSMAT